MSLISSQFSQPPEVQFFPANIAIKISLNQFDRNNSSRMGVAMNKTLPLNGNSKGRRVMHLMVLTALSLLALSASACAIVYHRVEVQPVNQQKTVEAKNPVRVHLTDGSTGYYPRGVTVSGRMLEGTGYHYDIALKPLPENPVLTPVPLDSVAAMETFKLCVSRGKTAAFLPVSVLMSAVLIGARVGPGGETIDVGMTMDQFPLLSSARGIIVQITADKWFVWGELIAVQPDGLIILSKGKLKLIPYATIIKAKFEEGASLHSIKNRRTPNSNALAHLKLFCRYPQGLSPGLRQKLLALHGQTGLASAAE
jgi:hypothetical protein